jgi:hypothetical protein
VHNFVPRDGSIAFANLRAGVHTVTLESVAENCAVSGSAARSVTVAAGGTVAVDFEV